MAVFLQVMFKIENEIVARLKIKSNAPPSTSGTLGIVPDYISLGDSDGVLVSDDDSCVDSLHPIVVYTGHDDSLSPILLLEETDYWISVRDISINHEVSDIFGYLMSNSYDISVKHSDDDETDPYLINFRSFAGKGYFDLKCDGKRIAIPFEVRSRKIGYRSDYPKMMADIAEFSIQPLIYYNAPLFRSYGIRKKDLRLCYEDFLLLEYFFDKMGLEDAFEDIRRSPYSALSSLNFQMPAALATYVDPEVFLSHDICGSLHEYKVTKFLHYCPEYVTCRRGYDSVDVPENRLIKDFLMSVSVIVEDLLPNEESEENFSDYIVNRLNKMSDYLKDALSEQWLSDVGELHEVPINSTVLQMRHGYSEIFQMYQMLGYGAVFSNEDRDEFVNAHQSRVHFVYEYWCYIKLYECLYSLSTNYPKLEIRETSGKWSMSIRKKKPIVFEIPVGEDGNVLEVKYYLNLVFKKGSSAHRTYSLRLRPDYTLIVSIKGDKTKSFIVNFDAKYKFKIKSMDKAELDDVNIDSTCWEYDVYKMHTYRDAVINSIGSYVLYPGREVNVFVKASENDWKDRAERYVPSVGYISMNPGSYSDDVLRKHLKELFNRIDKISSGDWNALSLESYW